MVMVTEAPPNMVYIVHGDLLVTFDAPLPIRIKTWICPLEEVGVLDDLYSFENWPLARERNRAELLRLKHGHVLWPAPAYDLNKDLLHPSTYRQCLRGAIMEIHFTLTHWSIASSVCDVYGAVMKAIRILVPPVVSPSAGKKRKLPLHLDIDKMPVKKAAGGDEVIAFCLGWFWLTAHQSTHTILGRDTSSLDTASFH
ncbi:hypothetical protein BKA83DRAFT_4329313 [Pisolithus microcarpus]|nr:hypothetical protein BKA83DRAFT_4329313 [Pisolithus microcarpus]